jgi:hypothetical protein
MGSSRNLPQRNEWLTTLNERSLEVHIEGVEHSFSFHVLTNENNEIKILDESNERIPYLSTALQDGTNTTRFCDLVEHLVRYKSVAALSNNILSDSSQQSFRFDVYMLNHQEAIHPESLVELEDGGEMRLVVENKGTKPLYLFVYNLGPCWEIENILKASYEVIPPKLPELSFRGVTRKKIKMKVPEELRNEGYRECDDMIKVFLTSRPTSFDLFELPKLNEQAKRPVNSNEDRTEAADDLPEYWAALNFPVRTSVVRC